MKLHTLFFLATLPAFGQFSITPPIIHDIEAGTQQAQQLAPIIIQQGGGAAYRVRLKSGGRWLPLTGLIARLDVRSSASSTEAILISGTPITNATPHYFAISITSAHTGTPLDGWRYAVIIEQGGEGYVLGEGQIDILPTAWAGAGTTPVAVAFDWSRYGAFTNTLSDGAYIFGTGLTTTEGVDGRVTVDADAAQPEADPIALPIATNALAVAEAHAAATNNPHGVTAAQIGALTEESDTLATVMARGGTTTEPMTIGSRGAGAVGILSFAQGVGVVASGNYGHAQGGGTTASGDFSHAQGDSTTASGDFSHAQGRNTTASGSVSHAQGGYTTASGEASHAQGDSTTASGFASHAQGFYTTASGDFSHAQGLYTTASGSYSHAQGYDTTASGDFSHAQGYITTASGEASHAAGFNATASHDSSWAWQGTAGAFDEPVYTSKGNGTFNVNPVGGLAGLFVGDTALSTTLAGKAATNHTHVIGEVTGLTDALAGKADVSAIIPPMYAPRQAVGWAATNTIALNAGKVIYTVAATNDTTLAFDFSAVDLAANVARWETWIDVASTNVSVALPGTNVVQYLDVPDLSTTKQPQTLQIAWQAWAVGGATNIQAHVYARQPEDE